MLNCLFNLSKKFEGLHDSVIHIDSDSMNNVYIGTSKKIYIMSVKRLVKGKDWISRIIDLKQLLKQSTLASSDELTWQFNGSSNKQDRAAQIEFIKFTLRDQNIPIVHSSLLGRRIITLNQDADLCCFKTIHLCPIVVNGFYVILALLNTGDGYIVAMSKQGQLNVSNINEEVITAFGEHKPNDRIPQILSISNSGTLITVLMDRSLYIGRVSLSSEQECKLNKITKIPMNNNLNDFNMIRQCVKRNTYHILLQDHLVLLQIELTLKNGQYFSHHITSVPLKSCLAVVWKFNEQFTHTEECNCTIYVQSNLEISKYTLNNLEKYYMLKLPSFTTIKSQQQIDSNSILFFGNATYNCLEQDQSHKLELFNIVATAQSKSKILTLLTGSTGPTEQKYGNVLISCFQLRPSQIIFQMVNTILGNTKPLGISNVFYPKEPISFHDVVFYLANQSQSVFLEMLEIALALYDKKTYKNRKGDNQKFYIEEAGTIETYLYKQNNNISIVQKVTQILLVNLVLMAQNDLKEWQEVYAKIYLDSLYMIEESLRIYAKNVKNHYNSALHELLKVQIGIIECQQNRKEQSSPINEKNWRHLNQQDQLGKMYQQFQQPIPKQTDFQILKNCPICNIELGQHEWTKCSNSHQYLRCNITQIPLGDQALLVCSSCKFTMIDLFTTPTHIPYKSYLLAPYCCPVCWNLMKPVL